MTIKLELADSSRETYYHVISYAMDDKTLSIVNRTSTVSLIGSKLSHHEGTHQFNIGREEILKMEVE